MISKKEIKLSTPGNEMYFSLSEFEHVAADSSIKFVLNARSQYLEIHNFSFYSEMYKFKQLLNGITNIYNTLTGEIKLSEIIEHDLIKISGNKIGQLFIYCEVYCYGELDDVCKLGFQADQSYLPSFIEMIRDVYSDLKIEH